MNNATHSKILEVYVGLRACSALIVHICVKGWYVSVCACACMCVEARGQPWVLFFKRHHAPCIYETESLIGLEFIECIN